MYDKLIQLLMRMVIDPDKAIIMGGTYRIPVLVGLQSKDFIEELQKDGTFNDATFAREYKDLYSLNIVNCWKTLRASQMEDWAISSQAFRGRFNDYPKWSKADFRMKRNTSYI